MKVNLKKLGLPYKASRYKALAAENQKILDKLDAKEFIEKRGPESQQEE